VNAERVPHAQVVLWMQRGLVGPTCRVLQYARVSFDQSVGVRPSESGGTIPRPVHSPSCAPIVNNGFPESAVAIDDARSVAPRSSTCEHTSSQTLVALFALWIGAGRDRARRRRPDRTQLLQNVSSTAAHGKRKRTVCEGIGETMTAISLRHLLNRSPGLRRLAGKGWRRFKLFVEGEQRSDVEPWIDALLRSMAPTEWRMLTQRYNDAVPLPPTAQNYLSNRSPRLQQLRETYARSHLPVTVPSVWNDTHLQDADLRYFRGESPYLWNYREWPRSMVLKYFIWTEYVASRDPRDLLRQLGEDGAFGCWTFEYRGYPRVSRDLLDSVNEIMFLDRQLGILERRSLRVLDIGSGYGRSAHRMIQAAPQIQDFCCVDVIPESTLICDYYLRFRRCTPPARVIPLSELPHALEPHHFDLAINVHSFSECTTEAIAWWIKLLDHLRIPDLLIVPNDEDQLLAFEPDGTRRDFRPLLEAAGYELAKSEPVIDDPGVRELLRLADQFLLFRRTNG
jgi:SAM-dependent methyltransferase